MYYYLIVNVEVRRWCDNQSVTDFIAIFHLDFPAYLNHHECKKNLYVPIIYSFFSIIDDHARMIFKP